MVTCSEGMTKQSPSPQHHSPAALRWPPREIQLSWAKVVGTRETRAAKTNASRARLPNMGEGPFRCPGAAIDQFNAKSPRVSGPLIGGDIAVHLEAVVEIVSTPDLVDSVAKQQGRARRPANQPLDFEV